jgi:hypothetical protein
MTPMTWLTWILFESLPALGAALGVALFVLLVLWRRGGSSRPLLIGLAVAAILLLVQTVVVTQREHAIRVLDVIERDVLEARTAGIVAQLAPSFEWQPLRPDESFAAFAERQFDRVRIQWIDRWLVRVVASQADRFTARVSYTAGVATGGYSGPLQSAWDFTFVRTADGWKIQRIEPRELAGRANPEWSAIQRR